jgi:DNA-binding transcriptional MerR regulator
MKETRPSIPDKLYFKIGEVSKIADIRPHVLRYWESEFKALKPVKSKSGQRVYRRKDVETVLKIKNLLYAQRYTIEGAKKKLKQKAVSEKPVKQLNLALNKAQVKETLEEIKKELSSIAEMLSNEP